MGVMFLLGGANIGLVIPPAYLVFALCRIASLGCAANNTPSSASSAVTGRVVDRYTNIYLVKIFALYDIKINYAKKVIEKSHETFQQEMWLYTYMEILLSVLNGFYDVEKSTIIIDGQIVAVVTQDSLRAVIGMVQQNSSLLHRTLRENVICLIPMPTKTRLFLLQKKLRRIILLLD